MGAKPLILITRPSTYKKKLIYSIVIGALDMPT